MATDDGSKVLRWLRGRPSTTEDTRTLWMKSLLNALLFFGIFMVALPWVAHTVLPLSLPVPVEIGVWGGGGFLVIGIAGWMASINAFVQQGRGTPLPADAPDRLVTKGLFRIVRNPMITSELMVIWGEALYVASVGSALYGVVITIVAHLVVVRVEEPVLRKRFGDSYEIYCRNVPRWFPRFRLGGSEGQ